jgi:Cryptococcal mannosyltransferase 1
LASIFNAFLLFAVFTIVFRPSYSNPPEHYKTLANRCGGSSELGRGNINNEKVFIAASLYDPQGSLLGGSWGKAVVELVKLLGPDNVHLSVYENDPDPLAKASLEAIRDQVPREFRNP